MDPFVEERQTSRRRGFETHRRPWFSGGLSVDYGCMAPPAVTEKEMTPFAVAIVLPPDVTVTTWLPPVADTETA